MEVAELRKYEYPGGRGGGEGIAKLGELKIPDRSGQVGPGDSLDVGSQLATRDMVSLTEYPDDVQLRNTNTR